MKTLLHAVHLSKDRFKTAREAHKWLTSNDIKPIKPVHKTDNFYEYRINEQIPNRKFTSKYIDNGILFVFQVVPNKYQTGGIKLFEKNEDVAEVKKLVDEFKTMSFKDFFDKINSEGIDYYKNPLIELINKRLNNKCI